VALGLDLGGGTKVTMHEGMEMGDTPCKLGKREGFGLIGWGTGSYLSLDFKVS